MGWQVDKATGNIRKDTVSALRVMSTENLTSAPEATSEATCGGIIDKNDTDVLSDDGLIKNLKFYDNLGYEYTARFSIKSTGTDGEFTVELLNVLDGDGNTYYDPEPALNALFGNTEDATKSYTLGKDYTYVSANVIVDKSGNYYQYNATTHSYDQVNSATDMTVVTAGALSLTQVYGAGADILAKADAYTGNGTGTYIQQCISQIKLQHGRRNIFKGWKRGGCEECWTEHVPVRRTVRKYQCGLQHLQEYEQRRQVYRNDEQGRYRRNDRSR